MLQHDFDHFLQKGEDFEDFTLFLIIDLPSEVGAGNKCQA